MSAAHHVFETLSRESVTRAIDPVVALALDQPPPMDQRWLPDALLSLAGTPELDSLTPEQKRKLSQLEFSLMCSISCSGEKEVIANIARLMLKKRFAHARTYLYHFIKEEANHIYVFSEFCARYGSLYPSLYSYVQGDLWQDDELSDLMTFVHVLVFEELGHGLNEIIAQDDGVPAIVRAINAYHVEDEGRHISFGRHLVKELTADLLPRKAPAVVGALRAHVTRFLDSRHIDYHNLHIYKSVGLKDAFKLRERLVSGRHVEFFAKDSRTRGRVQSLLKFLVKVGLIEGHPYLQAAAHQARKHGLQG